MTKKTMPIIPHQTYKIICQVFNVTFDEDDACFPHSKNSVLSLTMVVFSSKDCYENVFAPLKTRI